MSYDPEGEQTVAEPTPSLDESVVAGEPVPEQIA